MMIVYLRYVNVLNPRQVEAIIFYRGFGEHWKIHSKPFGTATADNIQAARDYANLFHIGDSEDDHSQD